MIRMFTAVAAAALLAGCASTPDQVAERQERQYRTGSNIAVRDGDMAGPEKSVKPDTVPIFKGPGPKVGPTGAGGG
jgi:type IV pilus biogenesis protein CpaD/CtpE